MRTISFYWNLEGTGPIDPAVPFNLGDLDSPGELTPIELSFYYEANPYQAKLFDCGFYLARFDHVYPQVLVSSSTQDYRELQSWGDLQGPTISGLQINLDKKNNYPENSWQTFSRQQGSSIFNKIPLSKDGVSLGGGTFYSYDRELPLVGKVYFKLQIVAPSSADRAGLHYFNLNFDYQL